MEIDAGCAVGTLIDLSEPVPCESENKENSVPVTEAIEVTRKTSQPDCRLEVEDSLKQEIVDKLETAPQPQNSLSDVGLIEDEVFDFDLPVTPESGGREKEEEKAAKANEEEEVFFGPIGFTEKCIAAGVAEETIRPLTPLRPDQMAEISKEAFSVACGIAMMRPNSSSSSVSRSPAKPSAPRRRKLSNLVSDDSDRNGRTGSEAEKESANPSPRKRRRSQTFSKESSQDCDSNSEDRRHKRKSTFTKEEPVESLRTSSVGLSEGKGHKMSAGGVVRSGQKEAKTVVAPERSQAGSRLQPPSKLRRYNKSQPNLVKPKPSAAETGSETESKAGGDRVTSSIPPVSRKSLQLPKGTGAANMQRQHRKSGEKGSDSDSCDRGQAEKAAAPRPRPGVRRAQSLNLKSGLPSGRVSKLALPSSKSAAVSGQRAGGESGPDTATVSGAIKKSSGIPKGPATKLQLMQPGQLQRKVFAAGRGGKTASSVVASGPGPLKASAPIKPNLGQTVERPHNPALAAVAAGEGGNTPCPSTPATHKTVAPRVLSLSSEASTPAKSSCSSSSMCGSTPGSLTKRMSMLPMSAKRRSGVSSLPPPSPMSLGSSSSSVSKRSLASSSDAADSPVFDPRMSSRLARSRRASGAKPRKPLVQNTPDLPKRSLSKWSPVRKPKAMPLEDQVSMCTKRVTPP